MEPLRNSLGKFREENNAMRAQSAGLCSSIEELDLTIKMLNDRMVHESIPLSEEKRLVKEIKDLEKTRSKVISNAANRAKLQGTVVEKEIKRQEEIEKNKLALERKKKQAEKQAAKAAARAQKEAEKKLKKEEKKAKKKSGAADTDEPSESDAKSDEAMEAPVEQEVAPASTMIKKEQKESARHRNVVSKAPPPKAILKRKKAQSYWSWAGPAAMVAAVLVALLAVLGYYQYYLPANASN
ncbi:Proton pump-interactor 1 [Zea mays]|uniref:Proton pump-interactor 1 n=1 Tax=Zea mays TaxID=4577 RepID=A0A1D6I2K8_MAIZE|nr:Proton pump-interactor 1 [Zea mays]